MTVLPVITRELRAAARRTSTYGLRLQATAALLAVYVWVSLTQDLGPQGGGELLLYLHRTLFLTIWLLVPIMTADCISRERREGTLPLLFLTPLRPGGIVLAKSLAQGLSAFALWLAALPVLTIPFVGGGVGWREALLSALVNFSSLCLAIGAGVVASANNKVFLRALILTACLAFGCAFLFILGAGCVLCVALNHVLPPGSSDPLDFGICFQAGQEVLLNADNIWQTRMTAPGGGFGWILTAMAVTAGLSALVLYLLIRLAAWEVKRVWREPPPSARAIWFQKKFCTPICFRPFFHRWMRWELERNPVGWLERRTWSGRLVIWSWLAVVISIYSSVLTNAHVYARSFHIMQCVLAWVLVLNLAVSAAGSFRRERESGFLELLLIAPLREWQILGGRLRGLWFQFLPALALLFTVWFYCASFLGSGHEMGSVLFFAGTFLALPIIGLYCSLAARGFFGAIFATLFLAVGLPGLFAESGVLVDFGVSSAASTGGEFNPATSWLFTPVQFIIAAVLGWRLYANLKYRKFALGRGA